MFILTAHDRLHSARLCLFFLLDPISKSLRRQPLMSMYACCGQSESCGFCKAPWVPQLGDPKVFSVPNVLLTVREAAAAGGGVRGHEADIKIVPQVMCDVTAGLCLHMSIAWTRGSLEESLQLLCHWHAFFLALDSRWIVSGGGRQRAGGMPLCSSHCNLQNNHDDEVAQGFSLFDPDVCFTWGLVSASSSHGMKW